MASARAEPLTCVRQGLGVATGASGPRLLVVGVFGLVIVVWEPREG